MPGDALPEFDQATVDACAAVTIKNAADVLAACGNDSFYAWFNTLFKDSAVFAKRFPAEDSDANRTAFVTFWDQVRTIFDRDSVSGLEFCALMGINFQEAGGKLTGSTERVNKMNRPHPGLAYAFDKIGQKASYNNGGSNRTAFALFGDPLFVAAHGQKSGAAAILNRPGGIDRRWDGDVWPDDVPADPDTTKNGFIMEADFFKFRGRGVIQTTWRKTYQDVIKWILADGAAANPALAAIAQRWKDATQDVAPADQLGAIATIATNADLDAVFSQAITLAKGIAIFSASKKNFLNSLKRDRATLEASKTTVGSLRFFASCINGGDYPEEVAPKMQALICGLAKAQRDRPQANALIS